MKALLKHAISAVSQMAQYHDFHPVRLARQWAAQDTLEYIKEKMPLAAGFYHDDDLLDYAVRSADRPGYFLEFGVFKGRSIRRIAKRIGPQKKVHGFDSFEGLPEAWSGNGLGAGTFSRQGRLPRVPANVSLHKGWFNETLPGWLLGHSEPASFIHIDCDLYSSTKTIFDVLGDRIQNGAILAFDEYFNYPGWRENEFKAFQEWVKSRAVTYDYLAYSWAQVVVRIASVGPSVGNSSENQ